MPYPNAPLTNARLHRTVRAWLAGLSIASALIAVGGAAAQAQTQPRPAVEAAPQAGPGFLGPRPRPDPPGTSHEAYLKAMFTDAEIKSYGNDDALRLALRRSEVDFIFGDAISLAFWINGTDSGECCAFSGGPFVESRYFGEGIGIAVRKGNDLLRTSLNWALFRVWGKGRYTDLWLRYFSVSPL